MNRIRSNMTGTVPMNNMASLIQQFNRFRAGYQGNPKAEVERLLQNGQMSQMQLNQLQNMAAQLINAMRQ